ncbi:Mitochondrial import motor associating protein [Candidozyma auris]|uniref:hypothetical_protein n=1 Tax=Candidozyma auris TaxID=498019 RepID=UPI000B90EE27|nr:hypothetical_protein [[Candida] auris]KND98322.2 mitochondrial mitochondrial membrane [[Candida] auris]PIS54008.1 hypothetical protein CJI97_003706 [[Candida] auris]PSK77496.1 hypothetical protein CJJ07_002679 [[Candida] auris]QEL58436.1 hypothetical protein CJJ09_000472 [[Candida] auris]QEO21322.1 hypothetical_protein [[Candida] auris]
MVVPIVVGLGVTVAALTARAAIATAQRYQRLSPQMIATLNNIRLERTSNTSLKDSGAKAEHIRYLMGRFNNTGFRDPMTENEALQVLGIEASEISRLDKNLLRSRYRKLMVMNHPDKNGSQYLSQKINEAKDVLEKSYLLKK